MCPLFVFVRMCGVAGLCVRTFNEVRSHKVQDCRGSVRWAKGGKSQEIMVCPSHLNFCLDFFTS